MRGGLKEMRGNKLMGNQKKGNMDAVFKDLRERRERYGMLKFRDFQKENIQLANIT